MHSGHCVSCAAPPGQGDRYPVQSSVFHLHQWLALSSVADCHNQVFGVKKAKPKDIWFLHWRMQVLNVLLEEKTLQTNCVRFASLTQKLPLWKPASALQLHSNPEVKGCRFCANNTYLWTRIKISDNIWLFHNSRGVVDIQRLAIPGSWLQVVQLGKTPALFDRPLCRQTGWSRLSSKS